MNKKILKSILCVASGIAITSSIPFAVTSCGCSSEKNNSLPDSVYIIENNVLQGFKSDFLNNPDSEIYKDNFQDCDTMQIPANVTSVNGFAFYDDTKYETTIPSFITKLTFADGSNCSSIGNVAYGSCSSLNSVSFPSSLQTIGRSGFANCPNLSSITWDAWNGNTSLDASSFVGVYQDAGTVTVTNPTDPDHNSAALLRYLLTNGGLPELWGKLPEEVYDIDENGVLKGFTQSFLDNKDAYSQYNTMQIPASVKSIPNSAFSSSKNIPNFISNLTFAENSNCSSIGVETFYGFESLISINFSNAINLLTIDQYCFFRNLSLTYVIFSNSLKTIDFGCFGDCSALNFITWNLPDDYQTSITIGERAFSGISNSGTVRSLNERISSQELLSWIKQKGDFPASDDWKAA